MRQQHATIRSVTKCAICIAKEQGVENPEDYVLTQYAMPDPTKPPVPIEMDDSLYGGVLMLYPESVQEQTGIIPLAGGVVGTVKSIFRTLGFGKGDESPVVPSPETGDGTVSQELARSKRGTGLYGKSKAKRS